MSLNMDVSRSEIQSRSKISFRSHDIKFVNALQLIQKREFHLAKEQLILLLQKDPYHVGAIHWLAKLYASTGDYAQAESHLVSLIRLLPLGDFYVDLGEVLYGQRKYELALHHYERALDLAEPTYPYVFDALKALGNIYLRFGECRQAERMYDRAESIFGKSDIIQVNRGTLAIQENDFERASAHFQEALAMNAENDKAWVGMSLLHCSKGDSELAWANVERALDINPGNRTGIELLRAWKNRQGQECRFVERASDYLEVLPDDKEVRQWWIESLNFIGLTYVAELETWILKMGDISIG